MPILVSPRNVKTTVRINNVNDASHILSCDAEPFYDYNGEVIAFIDSNSRYSDREVNIPLMEYICKRMNRSLLSIHLIRGDGIVIVKPV